MKNKIRIGTRKSLLALIQTCLVTEQIRCHFPDLEPEVIPMSTKGDERLDRSLDSFGGKGVFTGELEQALLEGRIDLAVHSAKDMPVRLLDGLAMASVCTRGTVNDVVVTMNGIPVRQMESGCVVGTGSLRRALQLKALNPKIEIKPIRGNVQTRLLKLERKEYDAIVLAKAGLDRLMALKSSQWLTKCLGEQAMTDFDYSRFKYEPVSETDLIPAACQGILAAEYRKSDVRIENIIKAVSDSKTQAMLMAERAFLNGIGGSCNAPAAAVSRVTGGGLELTAYFADNGKNGEKITVSGLLKSAEDIGSAAAARLLSPIKPGHVYLVGTGPGDEGLITVRGLQYLKTADVVVYDSLASENLLVYVRPDAELIFAGKRSGHHFMTQEEINHCLVRAALDGKNVVRLKGGDPLIFGRGGEECLALRAHGIDFEIVPGVSSAYAVAAYQGIPVTHRGMASSFHVITGHSADGPDALRPDYKMLARTEGTLVFLMGLKNLEEICGRLIQAGKDPKTPAAVIEKGTMPGQRLAMGTLESIGDVVKKLKIKTPAITIVGPVVSLHGALNWYHAQPLMGKSVLITGTRAVSEKLGKSLQALGADCIHVPLIDIQAICDVRIKEALMSIDQYRWIVLTSKNGVDLFFEKLRAYKIDLRLFSHIKFAVIGQGTADALADHGIYCDCMPDTYTSQELSKVLPAYLRQIAENEKKNHDYEETDHDHQINYQTGQRVLLLRAKEASRILDEALAEANIPFDAIAFYETKTDERRRGQLLEAAAQADYVTFCSASAVAAFDTLLPDARNISGKVICIGPVTAQAAIDREIKVYRTAGEFTVDGIVACIKEDIASEERKRFE